MSGKRLLLVMAWLFGLSLAPLRAEETGFVERTHRDPDNRECQYYLFVPHDYRGDKPYPLIVFLHGSGETGTDGKRATQVGIGPAVRRQEKTFPFLVLFPQGRRPSWDADSEAGQRALAILNEVKKAYRVDPKRIYLTGLSSGGDGTWSLAMKHPEIWAAIVPICGVGDPKQASKIKDVPCWCFEGARDNPRDLATTRALIRALKEMGAKVRYTEYPDLNHYCWDPTYAKPELYEWLLKQRRK